MSAMIRTAFLKGLFLSLHFPMDILSDFGRDFF
nr:MAG TPA: hypothetical protein [Caudoviricetes sp.]